MISIIERKLPPQCFGEKLSVTYQKQTYELTKNWGLISRDKVSNKWKQYGFPELSEYCTHISFEALVESFGSKDDFNYLVSGLIKADYYKLWF